MGAHGHGSGHGHDHAGGGRPQGPLAILALVLVALTLAGLVALWPTERGPSPFDELGFLDQFHDAEVEGVDDCPENFDETCRITDLRLLAGPDEGELITIEAFFGDLEIGDRLVLSFNDDPNLPEELRYQVADRARKPVLTWLAVGFAVAVVALGRLRGLAALAGLVVSLLVLLQFTLPALLDGKPALPVAAVSAAAIAITALYLAHGVTAMITVALAGTMAALALTTVLATVFVELAQFSGLASEDAVYLFTVGAPIDLRGLVLAGIVIGALGALDDMTVTQASVVWELKTADPTMSRRQLYRAGHRVGRDHVASTVNTLVLAYVGASLPLALLLTETGQSLGTVANSEVIATEIVRTLVGSLGLVASVPLTTWIATWVVTTTPATEPADDLTELAAEGPWWPEDPSGGGDDVDPRTGDAHPDI